MLNDIVADLTNTEWEIWDSRRVKREYSFDKRMNIQGLLVSPEGKRYGLYVLGSSTLSQTIGKYNQKFVLIQLN